MSKTDIRATPVTGTRAEAERIAARFQEHNGVLLPDVERLLDAIDKALQARDERAAKIAESAFSPAHTYASENAERYHAFDDGQKHAINKIASAIRKDTP